MKIKIWLEKNFLNYIFNIFKACLSHDTDACLLKACLGQIETTFKSKLHENVNVIWDFKTKSLVDVSLSPISQPRTLFKIEMNIKMKRHPSMILKY